MLKQAGHIVAKEKSTIWVQIDDSASCESCNAAIGCKQGFLAKLFMRKKNYIEVKISSLSQENINIGDKVIVGVSESAVTKASILIYLIPLFGLIGGTVLGNLLQHQEHFIILYSLIGVLLSYILVKLYITRAEITHKLVQPILINLDSKSNKIQLIHKC